MYVRHPELAAAKENRDYVLKQVCEAVNTISDVAQGKIPPQSSTETAYEGPGVLAAALDDFDVCSIIIKTNILYIETVLVILVNYRIGKNGYGSIDL